MNIIGIDACRSGWCGVGVIDHQKIWGCFGSLRELTNFYPNLQRVLIDIPIGLSSKNFSRTVDAKARAYLGQRKSSIFSPPCREAIYAHNYKDALNINKGICGKGISIQAYNISQKIKEIDEWTDTKPEAIKIFEAHPELCFKTLNLNQDLEFSKHVKAGIAERLNILLQTDDSLKVIYEDLLKEYKRSQLKRDDILDAMALYLINLNSPDLKYFEDENNLDASGKAVRIVYG